MKSLQLLRQNQNTTLKSRIVAPAAISGNLRFLTFLDRKNGSDIGAGASVKAEPVIKDLCNRLF